MFMMNDILFRTQLTYQINANLNNEPEPTVSHIDYTQVNLRNCTFADFFGALIYTREKNPDFNFMDSSLDAIKPSNFSESKKYNFIELTEYAKHTAVTIGNMTLFSELQKISSAIDSFNASKSSDTAAQNTPIMSFDDYNNYEIKQQPATAEELGSCVISGGIDGSVKITATFHESSTADHPIISIRFYSLNIGLYLTNRDIISIANIYKPNATLIEAFAYMSYHDYNNNHYNYSFDRLLISDSIEIDSLDDLYSKHYDLRIFDKLS